MQNPIEANNMAEIQRRVVLPVVQALLREGELDELLLRTDTPDDEWPWPGSVCLWLSARGEVYTYRLVPGFPEGSEAGDGADGADGADQADQAWDRDLVDAEAMAVDLYDDLRDWLCETQLSWGVLRDGDYDIPPPLAGA